MKRWDLLLLYTLRRTIVQNEILIIIQPKLDKIVVGTFNYKFLKDIIFIFYKKLFIVGHRNCFMRCLLKVHFLYRLG